MLSTRAKEVAVVSLSLGLSLSLLTAVLTGLVYAERASRVSDSHSGGLLGGTEQPAAFLEPG